MKGKTISLIVLNIILVCITVFVIDYAYFAHNFSANQDYRIDGEYYTAQVNDINKLNESAYDRLLDKIGDFDDIVVIAEYSDENFIGVYDPILFTKRLFYRDFPKYTRHFTKEDFLNNNPVAFYIDYSEDQSCGSLGEVTNREYISRYIGCVSKYGIDKYPPNISEIINLSAIKELPSKLTVKYNDDSTILTEEINELGYTIKPYSRTSLLEDTEDYTFLNKSLFYINGVLHILLFFVGYFYFYYQRKTLALHISLGGGKFKLFYNNLKVYFMTIPIQIILIMGLFSIYDLMFAQLKGVLWTDILAISIASYVYFTFTSFIGYLINYNQINKMGVSQNVK